MKAFGWLITGILFAVLSSIIHGWALVKLWGWFVYPYFDVPMITIPVAIGIALIVGMLAVKSDRIDSSKKQSTEDVIGGLIGNALSPLFVVFVGWVVTHWL